MTELGLWRVSKDGGDGSRVSILCGRLTEKERRSNGIGFGLGQGMFRL